MQLKGKAGDPTRVGVQCQREGECRNSFRWEGQLQRLPWLAIWRLALDRWGFWTQHHGMRPPKSERMRVVRRLVPLRPPITRTQPVAIGVLREEKRSSLMGTQQLASSWQEGARPLRLS